MFHPFLGGEALSAALADPSSTNHLTGLAHPRVDHFVGVNFFAVGTTHFNFDRIASWNIQSAQAEALLQEKPTIGSIREQRSALFFVQSRQHIEYNGNAPTI
jgi:hypothetical protein